jgi:hypothetical protein
MKRKTTLSLVVLLILVAFIATGIFFKERSQVVIGISQAHAAILTPAFDDYKYYILKDPRGFVLARAPKGANDQPVGTPQALTLFGNGFGVAETDTVTSMQLSPDKRFLEIRGTQDYGDSSWLFNTQSMQISMVPAHVLGNFLHWVPGGNGHTFLYRPMFPRDAQAPLDGNSWNPGLWVIDAATGEYSNLAIGMSSTYLADAVASPDGTQIIYSTTKGIGAGSDTWMMNMDGSGQKLLFHSAGAGQSIVGLFAWSPDSKKVAYERIADSNTPFQVAGLWVLDRKNGQQLRVGDADGGHGYAPSWSPDSKNVAFIVRTNIADVAANTQAQALQSGISIVHVQNNHSTMIASVRQTGVQLNTNPSWSKDSSSITFVAQNPANHVLGGSPRYYIAHVATESGSITTFAQGQVRPLTGTLSHIVAVN